MHLATYSQQIVQMPTNPQHPQQLPHLHACEVEPPRAATTARNTLYPVRPSLCQGPSLGAHRGVVLHCLTGLEFGFSHISKLATAAQE